MKHPELVVTLNGVPVADQAEGVRMFKEACRAKPPTAGMRMGDDLLREFYEKGRSIRRASWPAGDHIDTDGAEGGTIWYYRAEDDELTPGYRLGFHDLGAGDWEILDGTLSLSDANAAEREG